MFDIILLALQASCAAPQEQLFDCSWNIGGGGNSGRNGYENTQLAAANTISSSSTSFRPTSR